MASGRQQSWFATLRQGVPSGRLVLRLIDLGDWEAWAQGYRVRRRFWLDPDGWADHVIYAAIAD